MLVTAAAGVLVLAGCAVPPGEAPDAPDLLTGTEADRAVELGSPAADALARGLIGRLAEAMEEEGAVGALRFCAGEAIDLTRRIEADHDPRLELKRTTLQWRNPANAPDAWEERVLRYLDRLERQDPESVPGELAARGPEGTLRYYRVLRIAPMCLTCHGAESGLDSELRDTLQVRYPDDRATGYEVGGLRGVIRVDIPGPLAPGGAP